MSMVDRPELESLLKLLDECEPCEKHGREFLVICIEGSIDGRCGAVQCKECDKIPCQCWNDE